jgi:hypothetical protein
VGEGDGNVEQMNKEYRMMKWREPKDGKAQCNAEKKVERLKS